MVACALLIVPFLCLVAAPTSSQKAEWPRRRFEFKYSFKGPHLVFGDGSIPFWTHHGNALPRSDQVRIVPSMRSQSGSVWTKNSAAFENWEVEVAFRIIGRNRIGADGLAIWYTREKGPTGPVYGAADRWHGVGIFFDTFDNDGNQNNPIVLVVANDGKLTYDHLKDGTGQALGTCLRDYRNSYHAVRVRIRYYQKTLQVYLNLGRTGATENYELCTEVTNMYLPLDGHFGVSAATGAVADDHDVLSFITFSLSAPGTSQNDWTQAHMEQEEDEYQKEYKRFEKDLEKRKDEFRKQHPELHTPDEDAFETESQREFQMVVSGQSIIQEELTKLRERLAGAFEEHKQHSENFSKLSRDRRTSTTARESGHQDAVDSESLMNVLNGQKKMVQQVQELGMNIDNILSKVKLSQKSLNTMVADQNHFGEINEHISVVKKNIDSLMNAKVQHISCPKAPPVPSCLSVWHFLVFMVLQSVFFLYYLIHRNRRETNLKKVY
ncbi:protein ERGIC-53-like isoform X1 [Pristis pectinata]|uniref:protein ERGIC-53-like isoform X1 n=1 Tax=Pristis pectinata TaxID=685728 RepID=UPI00223E3FC6|nr:protein ERGIC-53-like isoform X1 [Pristis pectinata]